ncbi:outer membrane beta-barrel protein [soil metagenome]
MNRSMTTRLLSAAAATALLATAGAASAQSMWGYTPSTWSGPYVGIFGGATMENGDEDETLRFDRNLDGNYGDTVTLSGTGANAFSPGFCDGQANGNSAAQGCDDDSQGSQAFVRLGYDYQMGSFVLGVVADYGYAKQEDSVTGFSTTPANYTFTRTLGQTAGLRARAGYAYGPVLGYVTGGYAVAKIWNRFQTSNGANTFTATTDDRDADGYAAGGGLEWALAPHLSATVEYLYTSLDAGDNVIRVGPGTAPATNPFILAPNSTGTDMVRSNGKFGMHAVNIGMSYRF